MSPTTRAIGRSIGPTSSPGLSGRMVTVWHRSKAKVNRLLYNMLPNARTTPESACRLLYEIVEMIIAHLACDLDALKACSLTCRSWYSVAAPHIHHTLVLRDDFFGVASKGLKPLSKLHKLGLTSLVKEIQVRQRETMARRWFVPQTFSPRDLRYFSAFVNVQILNLQHVAIYRFIQDIRHYFGHFSPTLRSIALSDPICGNPRQLSYFLSLFSNLDDIWIWRVSTLKTPTPDTELVPLSAPKLRGRLTLHDFSWVETWTYLITSCGGLRFRHMDLGRAGGCAPVLLGACAETLETLRFYVTDGPGIHSFSFPKLDLSRLKVLRSLEFKASIPASGLVPTRRTILMEVFSTITSPVFSELVVVLGYNDIASLPSDVTLLRTLHAMNEVRSFKLVFLLVVSNGLQGEGRRGLVEALDSVIAARFLDFLDSPPTIRVA